MKNFRRIVMCNLVLTLIAAGAEAAPIELNISAGAGLKEALSETGQRYQASQPAVKLVFNFEASGTLQRQIEQGAPVDLFVSASVKQIDALEKKGMLEPGTRKNLLSNEMVLIAPVSSTIKSFADLASAKVQKLSLGTPAIVPAGEYAMGVLRHHGLAGKIKDKFVFGKNVRTVLAHVETGNADAGFVYRTDALLSKKVKIVATATPDSHQPIVYPLAIIKGTKHLATVTALVNYLRGPAARKVFTKYQFVVLGL